MALCALSARRIQLGVVFTLGTQLSETIDASVYLADARAALPGEVEQLRSVEYLQAINLICMTALETNDTPLLHKMLGLYHAALAEQNFCDEDRWPSDLSPVEQEERRRLFWHMYRLEVHSSVVLGHVVRCPERQAAVGYPGPFGEDEIKAEEAEWFAGWNFITDIYRGIEHLMAQIKFKRAITSRSGSQTLSTSFIFDFDANMQVLAPLSRVYCDLPEKFRIASRSSSNIASVRCGFQAANIACTYHLLRMVSLLATNGSLDDGCNTVLHLIDAISKIPAEYMRATSTAMLQELSGFGHILSRFISHDLSKIEYKQLRKVM
ncbi:hypothetical protein BJX64DRAFT_295447 [Aspergillus heterothallicus]